MPDYPNSNKDSAAPVPQPEQRERSRGSTTVVTGDTLAEFVAQKLNLEQSRDEKGRFTSNGAEGDTERERHHPIEERFEKITAQRREAEERAFAAERRAKEAEARESELRAKYEKPAEEEVRPDPANYSDIVKYSDDLMAWQAKRTARDIRAQEAADRAKLEAERTVAAWNARQADFRKSVPDYDQALNAAGTIPVPQKALDAIVRSDFGPQIAYHLARNTKILEALRDKPEIDAVRYIGRLEREIEAELANAEPLRTEVSGVERSAQNEPVEASRGSLAGISHAPPPLSPLRGASAPEPLIDSRGEFRGSYKEFKALRRAGKLS